MDWTSFERLCQDIAKAEGLTQVYRYGKQGQSQHGIDFRGESADGLRIAFQARRVAGISGSELREAVNNFASGRFAAQSDTLVICMSAEGNEAGFQDALAELRKECEFEIEIRDAPDLTHRLRGHRDLVQTYFGQDWVARFFADIPTVSQSLDSESLLLGPVEARGLKPKVEEAQRLADTAPADAARLYGEIADALREGFPGHAARFEQLRATSLKDAGDSAASHDLLMELATRNLFERAEPQLPSGVAHGLRRLHDTIDEVRRARGAAVILFEQWHERPDALEGLAACFDDLGPDDRYAPFIAVLLGEAALADRAFQRILDREATMRTAGGHGDEKIALRVRVALADASGAWQELASEAESLRFPTAEGAYVCLRAARWYAWDGQLERAENLYRLAMKLGAEAGFDLDVENALWSLTRLYTFPARAEELFETNQLALSIHGSRSYVTANSRTRERVYRNLANREIPGAHLWSRYRLLESIRSGCLADELESHATLARIYGQAGRPFAALEHAALGGAQNLVKDMAPQMDAWPEFLPDAIGSTAPWVRPVALLALEHAGDFAPPEVARELARELITRLQEDSDDMAVAPALFRALGAIVLEATDDDLRPLMPLLQRAAHRAPETYRFTDPGVLVVAARIYRFRPSLRRQAASILGDVAVGDLTGAWSGALAECGDDMRELVEALERVAEREGIDLAGPLSDLGHLNDATRARWSARIQFVADHPLGPRPQSSIGPSYYVPPDFLNDQSKDVVHQYVDKLIAIGSNPHEMAINRTAALGSAAEVMDALGPDTKEQLFRRVRPLTDPHIRISEMDEYAASSQDPLSRVRISFGGAVNVRAAAGWLLGHAATQPDECSAVIAMALDWIRSDDSILQQHGAALLTLPSLSADDALGDELATHTNPLVRRQAPRMSHMQASPDLATLVRLASDQDPSVRISAVYALHPIRDIDPESYERIRAGLEADQSAIVRAIAADMLEPAS